MPLGWLGSYHPLNSTRLVHLFLEVLINRQTKRCLNSNVPAKTGKKIMNTEAINLKEKFTKFSDLWSPRVVAEMNDYQFKLAKSKGEFVWHDHKDTDEVFSLFRVQCPLNLKIICFS